MSNIIELPRYQCHKQVWALKIKAIIPNPRGAELHFENDRYCPFEMPAEWVDKHQPQIGGYLVVYEGGYRSYSPAEAFESGYVLIDGREVAVGMDGAIYHNPEDTYRNAEDAECIAMCLDDAGVPRQDHNGLEYSLWGRVCRYSEYSRSVSEEELERLYWEFDDARSKSRENERLRFKETLRGLVRSLGHEVE